MNELVKKIRESKLGKKNITLVCAAMFAVLLLLFSTFTEKSQSVNEEKASVDSSEYVKKLENELESLVSDINGAGRVKVMITLESCYENVYAKEYGSKENFNENSHTYEDSEEYIIVKKGSNNEECLVIKVYEPQVKGEAVIAEGAADSTVKMAITQTVCALFDISSAKVSVEIMQKK